MLAIKKSVVKALDLFIKELSRQKTISEVEVKMSQKVCIMTVMNFIVRQQKLDTSLCTSRMTTVKRSFEILFETNNYSLENTFFLA